jgi:hypothetical protein
MKWIKAGKAAIKGLADATYGASRYVGKHEDTISEGVRSAIETTGRAVSKAGAATDQLGRDAEEQLSGRAAASNDALGRVAAGAGALLGKGVALTGAGIRAGGALTARAAPAVGAATGGFALGGASVVSEALDSVALSRNDLDELRREIAEYGDRIRRDSERLEQRVRLAQEARSRDELLDLLVVGGVSLAYVLDHPEQIPTEVLQAFELAYPGLASTESFADVVNRLPADALPGFVSGVKGKLFEVELVEHFNNGGLPDGLYADLGGSATQSGWDIRILDEQGQVVDEIQAKATESAHYVLNALERYPGIDVMSTSEVHAQLLAMGIAERVTNSGITEASLQSAVEHAAAGGVGFSVGDLMPSVLGLAVISLSLMLDPKMTWTERASQLGLRGARVGAAGAAAKVAMVVTQTWWLGLLTGVGSSWLASMGRARREQYEALRQAAELLRTLYGTAGPTGLLPIRT